MKKLFLLVLPLLILSSCIPSGGGDNSTSESTSQSLNEFENAVFDSLSFTYDGMPHILSEVRNVPEGTLVTYTGLEEHIDIGSYEASAKLSKEGYVEKTLTATLTINPIEFKNITFESASFEYDGQPHTISCRGVPSFATVNYANNVATAVGTYEATAIISAAHYRTLELHATLIITEPLLDFDDAKMDDLTISYDGQYHTIAPYDYPTGTTLRYIGTYEYKDVGSYRIACKLIKEGYHDKTLMAYLTIEKADMSGVTFEDASFFYDGNAHSITVKNAPAGSSVKYECINGSGSNSFTNLGEYQIKATVSHKNYNSLILTAWLKIVGYEAIASVDESKQPLELVEPLLWDDIYDALMAGNYSLRNYSGIWNDETPEEERYALTGSYTEFFSDGFEAVKVYHGRYSTPYEIYTIYDVVGDDAIVSNIQTDIESFTRTKFPARGMGETVYKYEAAYALVSLQEDLETGYILPGVDLDDYYHDVGTYQIKDNKFIVTEEHVNSGDHIYEIYEFYNIGNTKIDIPASFSPSAEEIANLSIERDFTLDGVRYGYTYFSSSNPNLFSVDVHVNYKRALFTKKGTRYCLPQIYDVVIRGYAYQFSFGQIYNHNMNGYDTYCYFNSDGAYQGEYASLGSVIVFSYGIGQFTMHGGPFHYYSDWH